MSGYGKVKNDYSSDIETGSEGLYPNISAEDNVLRWAFIRKVYGILSTQMMLTTAVAAVIVFSTPVKEFFASSPGLLLAIAFLPLVLMCPLYYYQQSHPLNLVLLGFFTVGVSLTVGISCAFTNGLIVLEALLLTATVVLSLTAYTYWASKNGYDFNFLGPILFVSVIVLVVFGLIQAIFPLGPLSTAIYGGLGSLVFSVYIVYDTDNLIKRFSYDEYIWASVALYLDIINLFLSILQLLRSLQGGDN
jgi:FtsH-binding integral membrane protein